MSFLKVFLFAILAAGVFGESELLDEKDVCQSGQNDKVFRRCLEDRGVLNMVYEVGLGSQLTGKTFRKALCKVVEKINLCVQNEGGFCPEQSQRGPRTIEFAQLLCDDEQLFDDLWNLINAFDKPYSADRLIEVFTSCMKEEFGTTTEELEKLFAPPDEKYARTAYACIVATALDVLEPENVKAAGRLFTAYYGVFGYDVADALLEVVDIN